MTILSSKPITTQSITYINARNTTLMQKKQSCYTNTSQQKHICTVTKKEVKQGMFYSIFITELSKVHKLLIARQCYVN